MDVTLVSTPPDTTSGTGQYADALGTELRERVSLSRRFLPTDEANPLPFLRRALDAGDAETDVVHVQFDYVLFGPLGAFTLFFFPLLWLQARRHDFAVVVTMHEVLNDALVTPPLAGTKALYARLLNTVIAATADRLVFLSGEAEERFLDSVGDVPRERIAHGVNLRQVRDIDADAAKREFGYDPETPLVVEPGYVSPRKGSDVFCDLAAHCPDVAFLLAGGPPRDRHTPFYDEICDRAPSNLTVTGRLPTERFHAAIAAADLVVLPYNETEQTGIVNAVNQSGVFNWCGAYGVPVIASDCPRFRTLRERWDAVRLFDPADLDDAERTLRAVLDDEAELERLAEAIEDYAREHSLAAAADDHVSLYRAVTGR
ncbi:glycosyltransferase [Haloarcula amylovorans]|uniref:glycosyltransferase n=1 Tax=Haloarcula amylovorans TaxID=2562280 RepID=UPI0014304E36|nr:glycosyltransferase [Halomicroarcula amylolytica]